MGKAFTGLSGPRTVDKLLLLVLENKPPPVFFENNPAEGVAGLLPNIVLLPEPVLPPNTAFELLDFTNGFDGALLDDPNSPPPGDEDVFWPKRPTDMF